MRWIDATAAVPATVAVSAGTPWPVVLVLGLSGLLVYGWLRYLSHREHMIALQNPSAQMAAVMRSINTRERLPRKGTA